MSIQSDFAFTLDFKEGNLNRLANLDENPKPYSGIVDFYEVEPWDLKQRILFVPKAAYHVVAELENGQDHYLSFDRRAAPAGTRRAQQLVRVGRTRQPAPRRPSGPE